MKNYQQLIGGALVDGEGVVSNVLNPANGEVLAELKTASEAQTTQALESAQAAFKTWSKTSLAEREGHIRKLIADLKDAKEAIKACLVLETGKADGIADYDFEMLPNCLDYFMEEAKRTHGEMIPDFEGGHMNLVFRKPLGVIACHLAWNFPLLNVGYKIGPILAAGCTCVIKPSSDTPLATLMVGEIIAKSGLPAGVVNVIAGSGAVVSTTMNKSTIPSMITLIGSTGTGRKIIEQSSTSVKQFSLELGGSAPVMVMKDADVYNAGQCTADGKFGNSGQVCVAPNRVFVHESVVDEFVASAKEFAAKVVLGTGTDAGDFIMGPMVNAKAQQAMADFVEDAVAKGATLVCGGKKAEGAGFFFEPTILTGVTPEMRVYQEEIFGPIMPILTFDDSADVVELANDTQFGLAAYAYTKDLSTALKLSTEIDSGSVCINEPFYSFQLPHGGCKQSGIGKDCSHLSLEEYSTVQRVSIKL